MLLQTVQIKTDKKAYPMDAMFTAKTIKKCNNINNGKIWHIVTKNDPIKSTKMLTGYTKQWKMMMLKNLGKLNQTNHCSTNHGNGKYTITVNTTGKLMNKTTSTSFQSKTNKHRLTTGVPVTTSPQPIAHHRLNHGKTTSKIY